MQHCEESVGGAQALVRRLKILAIALFAWILVTPALAAPSPRIIAVTFAGLVRRDRAESAATARTGRGLRRLWLAWPGPSADRGIRHADHAAVRRPSGDRLIGLGACSLADTQGLLDGAEQVLR